MVTKKRTTRKVAEAAPTYTARSRVRRSRPTQKTGAQGEALWQVFLTLPENERVTFIEKMLQDGERREDIMDICVVMARLNDPKDDYEEFEEELRGEGLL